MDLPISNLLDTAKNLSVNKEIIQRAADNLNLMFSSSDDFRGNICFADSPEVRSDFRETFTSSDLQNCLYAILYSLDNKQNGMKFLDMDLFHALIPTDNSAFWKLVEQGKELHKSNK